MADVNLNNDRSQNDGSGWDEYILDDRAFQFVRDHLRQYSTLAKLLDDHISHANGIVVTVAPRGLKVDDLSRPDEYSPSLDVGDRMMQRDPVAKIYVEAVDQRWRDEWAKILMDAVQLSRGGIVVSSEKAEPGDPWLSKVTQQAPEVMIKAFDKEVYFILPYENASIPTITTTLRLTSSQDMVVAVTDAVPRSVKETVTIHDLRRIAGESRQILVRAYDGEGFVCWKSKSLSRATGVVETVP